MKKLYPIILIAVFSFFIFVLSTNFVFAQTHPSYWQKLTFPVVISAATVDAINPCAFAVLIILMTVVLLKEKRKEALALGLTFTIAIYIAYFLMGVGVLSIIQATKVAHLFYLIVAILAIIIGLFNIKDYFFYGKWGIMEVPRKWRPKMMKVIGKVASVPGAFVSGLVVSLFLLPCTSGPYLVILSLLAQGEKFQGVLWLLFYNLIFILPMIAITLLIYFGLTSAEKLEELRQKRIRLLHLIVGIVMIVLGITLLIFY